MTGLRGKSTDEFIKISGDVWNTLIDKADMEAYDKIKVVSKGKGVVADGFLCCLFTDVSCLGLAEHAQMLMHPAPPQKSCIKNLSGSLGRVISEFRIATKWS